MDGHGGGVFRLRTAKEEADALRLYANELIWGRAFEDSASTRLYICQLPTRLFPFFVDADFKFTSLRD